MAVDVLATLRIKNLALAAELALELAPGFNAITGETGAGKSALLGGLSLLLGERADRSLLRAGADACSVEGSFHVPRLATRLNPLLEEHGCEPCEDGWLHLRRSFATNGSNRQFANGSPAPLALLARVGDLLVDIHGPHEHQSLLRPVRQLELLDAFAGLTQAGDSIAEAVTARAATIHALTENRALAAAWSREAELLAHQAREIEDARIDPGESEALEAACGRAANAARLLELGQNALAVLAEDDESAAARLAEAGRLLRELSRLDPGAAPLAESLGSIADGLRDLVHEVSRHLDPIEVDPAHLAQLESRLNLLNSLRRKYGSTLGDVIEHGRAARARLDAAGHRDAEQAALEAQIQALNSQIAREGSALSAARSAAAPRLGQAVSAQLERLGFRRRAFGVQLRQLSSPSSRGFDECDFDFAPNPGEPPKSLRAIASSGELARVMLAVKTGLAAQDDIPVLVFDEVDANIGGETAAVVGRMLRELGERRQVLCVTHLAPVAAAAAAHFKVEKTVRDNRSETRVARLDSGSRAAELARMLGGATEVSLSHARELMDRAVNTSTPVTQESTSGA